MPEQRLQRTRDAYEPPAERVCDLDQLDLETSTHRAQVLQRLADLTTNEPLEPTDETPWAV